MCNCEERINKLKEFIKDQFLIDKSNGYGPKHREHCRADPKNRSQHSYYNYCTEGCQEEFDKICEQLDRI